MRLVITIILITFSSNIIANEEWDVVFGWHSGWGGVSPSYKITSTGQISSYTYKDNKTKKCVNKLNKDKLEKIKEKIELVPSEIMEGTSTGFLSHCDDEKQNKVTVNLASKVKGFVFANDPSCNVNQPPAWLPSLYKELEQHIDTIENCKESDDSPNKAKQAGTH
tara:strand:- start:457 stop:951 length:495 start_codon:yes stop_codon:yes gene_type:complete